MENSKNENVNDGANKKTTNPKEYNDGVVVEVTSLRDSFKDRSTKLKQKITKMRDNFDVDEVRKTSDKRSCGNSVDGNIVENKRRTSTKGKQQPFGEGNSRRNSIPSEENNDNKQQSFNNNRGKNKTRIFSQTFKNGSLQKNVGTEKDVRYQIKNIRDKLHNYSKNDHSDNSFGRHFRSGVISSCRVDSDKSIDSSKSGNLDKFKLDVNQKNLFSNGKRRTNSERINTEIETACKSKRSLSLTDTMVESEDKKKLPKEPRKNRWRNRRKSKHDDSTGKNEHTPIYAEEINKLCINSETLLILDLLKMPVAEHEDFLLDLAKSKKILIENSSTKRYEFSPDITKFNSILLFGKYQRTFTPKEAQRLEAIANNSKSRNYFNNDHNSLSVNHHKLSESRDQRRDEKKIKIFEDYVNAIIAGDLDEETKKEFEFPVASRRKRSMNYICKEDFENKLENFAQKCVAAGLGIIVEGDIRINAKNNDQAFVKNTDGERDAFLCSQLVRKHALHGDIVRVFIKKINPAKFNNTIEKQTMQNQIPIAINDNDELNKNSDQNLTSELSTEEQNSLYDIIDKVDVSTIELSTEEQYSLYDIDKINLSIIEEKTSLEGFENSIIDKSMKDHSIDLADPDISVDINADPDISVDINADPDISVDINADPDISVDINADPDISVDINADFDITGDINADLTADLTTDITADTTVEDIIIIEEEPVILESSSKAFVIRIVQEVHNRRCVGVCLSYRKDSEYITLVPRDMKMPHLRIYREHWPEHVRNGNLNNIGENLYIAEIICWKNDICHGKILNAVGKCGDLESENKAILAQNNLHVEPFSEKFNELFNTPLEITEKDIEMREDMRSECIFTIDPLTAVDLDDALSCKKLDNGLYEIGVHISDVAHFLEEGSELDELIKLRTTSVYMVKEVFHMLPKSLCLKCSLLPGQDKFAFSVIWLINENAECLETKFKRTIINSCTQFAYEHAQQIIDYPDKVFESHDFPEIQGGFQITDIVEKVKQLNNLANKMREKRFNNGALKINKPKLYIDLHPETGEPLQFSTVELKTANFLIEEFMLLANQSVAEMIYKHFPDISILRCHTPPLKNVMQKVKDKLDKHGLALNVATSNSIHSSLINLIKNSSSPEAMEVILSHMVSKPMSRATYFCSEKFKEKQNFWHYALSVPIYTHFTSPIRRYPDLLVHRVLSAALGYSSPPIRTPDQLNVITAICNEQKYAAKLAGEDSYNLYFMYYIKSKKVVLMRAAIVDFFSNSFEVILIETGHLIRITYPRGTHLGDARITNDDSVQPRKAILKYFHNTPDEEIKILKNFDEIDVEVYVEKLKIKAKIPSKIPPKTLKKDNDKNEDQIDSQETCVTTSSNQEN